MGLMLWMSCYFKDLIHFEKKGIIVPQISFEKFNSLNGRSSQ
jgi:hypothetical protein